jgi:hypothetical protein
MKKKPNKRIKKIKFMIHKKKYFNLGFIFHICIYLKKIDPENN